MANCLLVNGYELTGCTKDNVGGLNKIYIANWKDVEANVTYNDTTGEVTGLGTGYDWYIFDLVKETSSWSESVTANVQNGTLSFIPSVVLVMNKLTTDQRNLVAMMATTLLSVIAEDNNGNLIMLGRVKGLDVTALEMGSGTANGDRNGVTVTMTGAEPKASAFLDASSVTALASLATY